MSTVLAASQRAIIDVNKNNKTKYEIVYVVLYSRGPLLIPKRILQIGRLVLEDNITYGNFTDILLIQFRPQLASEHPTLHNTRP